MALTIFFLCLAAALGTAGYLILRRLLQGAWTGWLEQRQGKLEDLQQERHTQALRREALDSVLAQIGRQDESGRKAA